MKRGFTKPQGAGWLQGLLMVGLWALLPFATPAATTHAAISVTTVEQAVYDYDSVRAYTDRGLPDSVAPRSTTPHPGQFAGLDAAKTTVKMTAGIEDAQGVVRFGGYDPATKTVHLGDVGHFGGIKAAGGTPLPGKTPGLSMLETEKEIIWANDSLSLPKALTADEAANIQKALQSQFPTKAVRQVTELR